MKNLSSFSCCNNDNNCFDPSQLLLKNNILIELIGYNIFKDFIILILYEKIKFCLFKSFDQKKILFFYNLIIVQLF